MPNRVAIIGNINTDVVLGRLSRLPGFGQEAVVKERTTRIAGAAGNTALALVALGICPLVVGAVGGDGQGRGILKELTARGVDVRGVHRSPTRETGTSYAVVGANGERAFVTYLGALEELTMSLIMSKYPLISEPEHVLVTGFFLMPKISIDEWIGFFKQLRTDRKSILLDLGWDPQGWPESVVAGLRQLLAMVDVFLPNQSEIIQMSGKADPVEGSRAILETGVREIVVKCGSRGSILVNQTEVIVHPGFDVPVADTVGAGDAFNAGLMYTMPRHRTSDALGFANAVASITISHDSHECPSLSVVREFIARARPPSEAKTGWCHEQPGDALGCLRRPRSCPWIGKFKKRTR